VDKTEKPEKNFAKGIIFAAIVISIGYSLAIFLWGVSANWQQVLSNNTTNLGNITYVLMKSLGMTLGKAMHLTPEASATMGIWFARITGLSMFLAYTGAFFTLIYSPLKAIIQGTPKALWPGRMTQLNTAGMPANAMWMQCLLVCVFILLVSFGGDTASAFYNKLTLMANVSMTLPYLFLTLAFPFFKAKQDLERPFVIFKTRAATLLATTVVVLVVAFANIFTIIQPVIEANDWNSALWMVGGRSSSRCWRWGFMRITVDARRRTSQKWRSGNIPSRKGGDGYKLPAGRVRAAEVSVLPVLRRPCFPDASGTVGTAYQYRARGSPPESAGGSHGAAAYGAPFRRRRYAARKSGSPAVNPPGTLPAPGYR
jgi:hypothetical protein